MTIGAFRFFREKVVAGNNFHFTETCENHCGQPLWARLAEWPIERLNQVKERNQAKGAATGALDNISNIS